LKVPHGWRRENIGKLFEVQLGKMLSKKAKTGKQFPYLANFNIRWGRIDFVKMNKMNFSAKERKKYSLQLGDLLVCEGGEVGRCAIWQDEEKEIYYQKALHRVRSISRHASTEYLYFYLQFIASQGKLISLVGETSIAHLTREKLVVLPLIFPPLPEQKAIADLLSTWDEAIGKTEKLIEAKEKRFKWLLNELIGGYCNRRGKREVKLYDLLGNALRVEKGKSLVEKNIEAGEIPVVAGGQSYAYFHKKSTHRGECITISASGAYAGYVWYHNYPIWASDCNVIVVLNGDTKYIFYALKHLQRRIFALQSGGAQPHIYAKDLYTLRIPYPSLQEQRRIAVTLSAAHEEIDILKKLADKYKVQKRGLMQRLLTGEWRVKLEGA